MTDVLANGPAEPGPEVNSSSLIAAAQQAAAAGDYSAAERLLHDAAARQEAALGSSHPDLATTLNNLAFVCERLNKFDEAERGYRRAHAIAVGSLGPGHPLIKTSLTNLLEFCAARGIPVWRPPAARTDDVSDEAQPPDVVMEFNAEAPPDDSPDPIVAANQWIPRLIAGTALAVIATFVVMNVASQDQGTEDTSPPPTSTRQETAPSQTVAPPPAPTGPAPGPSRESQPPATPERGPETSDAPVTVLNAQLCSGLEKRGSPDWQCTAAAGDLQPGTYTFYTRLLTTTQTTVEHRWYYGDRVHQVMRLRVPPSPGNGYRTFSATTVSPERAGDWKVELRAADGTLLRDEHFIIR